MAKQIYSFTKIEKKRTRAGIWTTMFGILLIIALLLLVVVSVYLAGKVPMAIASMGMFTFLLSILNYMVAKSKRNDDDMFGKCLRLGYVVSKVSVWLHVLVIFIGICSVIL